MAVSSRGPFEEKAKPYAHLQSVIYKGYTESLNFEDSLQAHVDMMRRNMEDIAEGEYNGMPIKERDQKHIPFYAQQAVQPLLNAAKAVMSTVSDGNGWTSSLWIDPGDRDMLVGTNVVDLLEAERVLVGGINEWLEAIQKLPESQDPGTPLAINSAIRQDLDGGIGRISDVLMLESGTGWKPMGFKTNSEASKALEASVVRDLERRSEAGKLKC